MPGTASPGETLLRGLMSPNMGSNGKLFAENHRTGGYNSLTKSLYRNSIN